jgi:hypothetical protein
MYALRERRQHVTQEDFEFAVAKVHSFPSQTNFRPLSNDHLVHIGLEKESRRKHKCQQTLQLVIFCILDYHYGPVMQFRIFECHLFQTSRMLPS